MRAKKAMVVAVAATVLSGAVSASATTDVVGHWSFDEGSGTTAADDSGAGHDGTLEGAASWAPGKRNGAIAFDGATGRVHVPTAAALEPGAITVSAWVKRTGSPGAFRYLLAKGASGCIAASYALYSGPDGGLEFYVAGAGGTSYTRSPDAGQGVWDGTWHHVAGTFDGNAVRLYVDGAEVGSGTTRSDAIDYGTLSSSALFVGHYDGCDGFDFGGSMDEPKIVGRALSATEVEAQANYPFSGFRAPVDNQPAVNVTKAGSAVPLKFSLAGDWGLGILAAGSPSSQPMTCSSTALLDQVEETATAGASGLQYDAAGDVYTYVWKTDKAWAGTCRMLSLRLDDGTVHTAAFKFSK